MNRLLPPLLLTAACLPAGDADADPPPLASTDNPTTQPTPATVRPGIEVLLTDSLSLVRGRRAALITNHTGRDRAGTPSIDLLADHPEVDLVALFSPEHGIRGSAEAGVRVESGVDERTGLPVHSLYGTTRAPTAEMLDGIEVLLFDIQDIGTRYYTYLSTMALAMEAAGEHGIPFVVLDRPNPIGGDPVQGNVLDSAFASFVGLYPVPMRHGLTAGEFARMAVGEFGVDVQLSVAVADGWKRTMPYEETGIPWVAPSPNMPSVESALHYPGTCLFEGTPISVGRGTEIAFQQVGAPWLDGEELAVRLTALGVPDARFEAVRFTPREPGTGSSGGRRSGGCGWWPRARTTTRRWRRSRYWWRSRPCRGIGGAGGRGTSTGWPGPMRCGRRSMKGRRMGSWRSGGGRGWRISWSDGRGICCTGEGQIPYFQSRTVNRYSSSIRSGSVPLCSRIPGMILIRTPMPRASTYP